MPFYQPPESDLERLNFLERAHTTAVRNREGGLSYLSVETENALAERFSRFHPAYRELAQLQGARAKEVGEKDAALAELELYVRDFVEVLNRRVRRLRQPIAIFNLYNLPQDGNPPRTSARDEWLRQASSLILGDANATAAGYPPMANPSAAELQARLTATQAEAADVAPANEALNRAQLSVAAQRPDVDLVIQEVVEEIRFVTRRHEASNQRRILRDYGARFGYLPDEPRDDDDPAEETPDAPPAP